MNNIFILIPIADPSLQDFDSLVNDLKGNYTPQDKEIEDLENGNETTIIVNPYKDLDPLDFSGKIILCSHSPIEAPSETESVVVDSELNLSKLWNAGIEYAEQNNATHIVILNEVSSINPYIFEEAIDQGAADVYNLSDGGCFIVTPEIRADEQYRFWFADVDLFNKNNTLSYRNDFIDIVQENRIPIEGNMQDIVDQDIENFNS